MVDTPPSSAVECREETITPPRGLRNVFKRMMELYRRGKPWMVVVAGNEAGVRMHETLPPRWEPK